MKKWIRQWANKIAINLVGASAFLLPAQLLSQPLICSNSECECQNDTIESGFYIGASGGLNLLRFRERLNIVEEEAGASLFHTGSHMGRGAVANILAGYGQFFGNFYLGIEGFANITSSEDKVSVIHTQGGVTDTGFESKRLKYGYGVSLLPGYKLTDTLLLYGRFGRSKGRFEVNTSISLDVPGIPFPIVSVVNFAKKDRRGHDFGLGVEKLLGNNVSLRLEYTYTYYKKLVPIEGEEYKPQNNQFLIGILYRFGGFCN
jgi:opacity protein-like surface antigen